MKRLSIVVMAIASMIGVAHAESNPVCNSDAVRLIALKRADHDVPIGVRLENITETRTIRSNGKSATCEVVVMWASREAESYQITVKHTGYKY